MSKQSNQRYRKETAKENGEKLNDTEVAKQTKKKSK